MICFKFGALFVLYPRMSVFYALEVVGITLIYSYAAQSRGECELTS